MEASKEVWGKIFGTVSTPERFEAKRREMAEREWRRLAANDSLECRNCHSFASMDFTRQGARAAEAHGTHLASGERTCIDCHKGIAHRLPDMRGVPGWDVTLGPAQ
jgi:cytochrome c-type protein NapC